MIIESLKLYNFRNYKQLDISFNSRLNVFVGNNAEGKTNLLEAIYFLATTKSFRSAKENEMIKHREHTGLVSGKIRRDAVHSLEIRLSEGTLKKIKYNQKDVQPKAYVGNFNVVLFTPEDLYLIKGSPSERRRFLNIEISQVDSFYRNLLLDYSRILGHRNSLLKDIVTGCGDRDQVQIWDSQLIDVGSKLIVKRGEMIHKLGLLSRLMHRKLSNGLEELILRYYPFYARHKETDFSYDSVKNRFTAALTEAKALELKRGFTLVGPQRDDFKFIINDLDARIYASQGQQRTAVLACRLAELEYMKSEIGKYPVILLDDVMSELDESRKQFLLNLLNQKVQTVITTTNIADFTSELLNDSAVFFVKSGQVSERRGS